MSDYNTAYNSGNSSVKVELDLINYANKEELKISHMLIPVVLH